MNELFDIPVSLSPKLKWLEKHGLEIEHFPDVVAGQECAETGDTIYPWSCHIKKPEGSLYAGSQIGTGATEEEAIIDYCHNSGTPHYSVENNP